MCKAHVQGTHASTFRSLLFPARPQTQVSDIHHNSLLLTQSHYVVKVTRLYQKYADADPLLTANN